MQNATVHRGRVEPHVIPHQYSTFESFSHLCNFISFCQALDEAERLGKTESTELFTDVYNKKPKHLLQQEKEFRAHLEKYPDVAAAH